MNSRTPDCGTMEGEPLQGRPDAAVTWFTQFQLHSVIKNGVIPEWFHGIITRKAAEELLLAKPPGYFLIRVSESRIGYTLSYRAEDRCRHFMIDALKDGYIIVGENTRHPLLQDLVDFHRRTPVRPFSELLTVPCGQMSDKADYAELLFPKRQLIKPNVSPLPDNSLHSNSSYLQLLPQDDPPPALPQRPSTMKNSAVPSPKAAKKPTVPNSHPNRLYPCLEEELPHLSVQTPAMVDSVKPMPLPRKRFLVNLIQPDQAPELPARNSYLPQRKDQTFTNPSSAHDSPSTFKLAFTLERTVPQPTAIDGLQSSNAISQPERNQDVKNPVAMNQVHAKKKFQRTRSIPEEQTYSEIGMEAEERHEGKLVTLVARDRDKARGGQVDNEYQELPGEQTVSSPPFPNTHTIMTLTGSELPLEYLIPPPFAPGY